MTAAAAPPIKPRLRSAALIECGHGKSRSCSWSRTGQYLAVGSFDRFPKIYTVDHVSAAAAAAPTAAAATGSAGAISTIAGSGRELQTLQGHAASVERVRFHPTEASLLLTASEDKTVRIWDVRSAGTSRCSSKIDTTTSAASVEWSTDSEARHLAISEKNDVIKVYDGRKTSKPIKMFDLSNECRVMETQFAPSGSHLVMAGKDVESGMGVIRVWRWDEETDTNIEDTSSHTFVGHTGTIFTLQFSPDGTRLATGGADALVSLWDVSSMVCCATMPRRAKFIRSVSFSHDSQLVATANEEEGIDLTDAETGDAVGVVKLMTEEKARIRERLGVTAGGGADEVAFHPKGYVLACARGYEAPSGGNPALANPAITVARLAIA